MLTKSLVAIVMLSLAFTATVFGQKGNAVPANAQRKSAKQFTGSDEELGALIAWLQSKRIAAKANEGLDSAKTFTGSDEELGALIAWLQAQRRASSKNINPQTANTPATQALDNGGEILGDDVQRRLSSNVNGRRAKTGRLIDTSTGEVVWADEAKKNKTDAPTTQRTGNKQEPFDRGYLSPNAKPQKRGRQAQSK